MVDILNPERIVIRGVFTRQNDYIWPEAAKALEEEALARSTEVCRVVPAALGERIGDYACLVVALE